MAVQIVDGLRHLADLIAQVADHHLQIGHVVIGQTLYLVDLADI